jgi:hypothetical protein
MLTSSSRALLLGFGRERVSAKHYLMLAQTIHILTVGLRLNYYEKELGGGVMTMSRKAQIGNKELEARQSRYR